MLKSVWIVSVRQTSQTVGDIVNYENHPTSIAAPAEI